MEEKEKILERKLNKLELVQNNRNMEYGMGKYTRKLKTNKQTKTTLVGGAGNAKGGEKGTVGRS